MRAKVSDPLVGQLLDGRYQVLSRIARGGMATVYLANDRHLHRDIALKVMHPHLADDEGFRRRFIREARAAASLSHPSAVGVFDQGQDGDAVYLTMEYVPGRTLRDLLNDKGALTPREAILVLEPVLDALATAHRSGLVHRDIKPENVLLTPDGRVKVADFGLARAGSAATTHSGPLMGTVAYLAPELISSGTADARSDVYAAGILLFEMLTGRQPYSGEHAAQVAYRHVSEDVPAPSSLLPGLPAELDHLVLRSAARDPLRRPADAEEMLHLLRRARANLSATELDQPVRLPQAPTSGGSPAGTTSVLADAGTGTAPPATAAGLGATAVPAPVHALAAGSPHQTSVLDSGRGTRRHRNRGDRRPGRPGGQPAWREDSGRRRHRRSAMFLVGTFAVTVVAGIGWFFVLGPGAFTTVPAVASKAQGAAVALANQRGLGASVVPTFDEAVPAGTVIRSDPKAGAQIRKSARLRLFVSRGPQLFAVPPVIGKTQEQARQRVADAQLAVGEVSQAFSETVPAGMVVSTDPDVGSQQRRGMQVTLVVSKGRQPIDIEDYREDKTSDVVAELKGLGLTVAVKRAPDDKVPAGEVVLQNPAPGSRLFKGDTITLVDSSGPPPVQVPSVFDLKYSRAKEILKKLGFEVDRTGTKKLDRVVTQDPPGGTLAPKGSTVTLSTL